MWLLFLFYSLCVCELIFFALIVALQDHGNASEDPLVLAVRLGANPQGSEEDVSWPTEGRHVHRALVQIVEPAEVSRTLRVPLGIDGHRFEVDDRQDWELWQSECVSNYASSCSLLVSPPNSPIPSCSSRQDSLRQVSRPYRLVRPPPCQSATARPR